MKTISWLPLLFLTFSIAAQKVSVSESVKNHFAEIPMGMTLEDFKKLRPKAKISEEAGFRVIAEEANPTKDIKEITYYFDNEDKMPFYEAIIEFKDLTTREAVQAKLLGKYNHPTQENHWIIYKGNEDFDMVAWTFNEKIVFAGKVPKSEWAEDGMFHFPENTEPTDLRFNKKNTFSPNTSKATCIDYAKTIAGIFQSGFHLGITADSLAILFPNIEKQKPVMDFKDEYILKFNEGGVKEATFVTDKDDNKPVYELILDFEDADSTRRLAEMMFGKPSHPTLEDHWTATGDVEGAITMIWLHESKMIVAVNMPKTEFEGDETFVMPEGGMVNKDEENNDDASGNLVVLQMNQYIEAATTDFEEFKGEAVPNKKDEFLAAIAFRGAEQTLVRKNTAGKWRLEARFPTYATLEEAKTAFEEQLNALQNLEGLEYRLIKKSDLETAKGRTYLWTIQTLDDTALDVILKLQFYPASNNQFGLKMELGK